MGNQVLHVDIKIEEISKNVLIENSLSKNAYIFAEAGLSGATTGSSFPMEYIKKIFYFFFSRTICPEKTNSTVSLI